MKSSIMSNLFNDKSRYPDLLFSLAACFLYVPSQGIAIPRIPTVLAVIFRKIYIDFLDAPSHSTDMVSRNNRLMVLQFLSMKLAAVNPGIDCTVDDFLCKQVGKVYWIVTGTQSNFLGFFSRLQSFTEHVQNDNSEVL